MLLQRDMWLLNQDRYGLAEKKAKQIQIYKYKHNKSGVRSGIYSKVNSLQH